MVLETDIPKGPCPLCPLVRPHCQEAEKVIHSMNIHHRYYAPGTSLGTSITDAVLDYTELPFYWKDRQKTGRGVLTDNYNGNQCFERNKL